MRWSPIFAALVFRGAAAFAQPQADITNGIVHARFYLPDTATGYYRATRFDWSGVMPVLEYNGHQYCGQWFPTYSPTINDAIMGPVESFWPLNYEKTPAGGTFVQPGVGTLVRPDTAHYSASRLYQVKDAGSWQVTHRKDRIAFRQHITDGDYGFVYTKTITLPKDEPQLVISHTLKNTGRAIIETNVFDHNFFIVDNHDLGPGFGLRFHFTLQPEGFRGARDLAAIAGDSIVILRNFTKGETVFALLKGYDSTAADYDFILENPVTGASLHIRGDKPLSRLVYWGYHNTLCPEPYIHIRIAPGDSFTWTLNYSFDQR